MTLDVDQVVVRRGITEIGPITFRVNKGEVLSICGKNGSGKTSSLYGITGMIRKQSGSVMIDGISSDTLRPREMARKITLVQQELPVPMSFTVKDVMEISAYSRGNDRNELMNALETCGISKLSGRDFATLSGGEKRMVSIAAAIYQDADYMLLDEPTSFLDIDRIHMLTKIIGRMKNVGKSIICVIHDVNFASSISDSMMLLKDGKTIAYGRKEDIMTVENMEKAYDAEFRSYSSPEGLRFYPVFPEDL